MKTNSKMPKKKPGRPSRTDKNNTLASSAEKGTIPGDKRKTYIVKAEHADKIDAIAYWQQTTVKEVVSDAFAAKITKFEKANGAIKLPSKK